jgi:hypothetical protein
MPAATQSTPTRAPALSSARLCRTGGGRSIAVTASCSTARAQPARTMRLSRRELAGHEPVHEADDLVNRGPLKDPGNESGHALIDARSPARASVLSR